MVQGRKAGVKNREPLTGYDGSFTGFVDFSKKELKTPKGKGARQPFNLRPWQAELLEPFYREEVHTACWVIPRGNGKSALAAAIALHHLFCSGIEGARVAIIAQDERSAKRMLETAARMVELNDQLAERVTVLKDKIDYPATGSVLLALPAEAHRVEGEDLTLAIVDEIGFVKRDTWEATVLSTGKREGSKTLAIGTPSPAKWREISPLLDLVEQGREGTDPGFVFKEFSAPYDADISSPATWKQANPAYGDWLTEPVIRRQLAQVSELEFRRARLGQWTVSSRESAFHEKDWQAMERMQVAIPAGKRVVVAFDGSVNNDSTAILIASVAKKPHFVVGGLWEPHKEVEGYTVPIREVEDRLREICSRYKVVELVADPFRWKRSLDQLEAEGLPVYAFNQSSARLAAATADLRAAARVHAFTHDGDQRLTRHALNAIIEETQNRGVKLSKPSRLQKIDLAACLVMAHSRATWLANPKNKQKLVKGY